MTPRSLSLWNHGGHGEHEGDSGGRYCAGSVAWARAGVVARRRGFEAMAPMLCVLVGPRIGLARRPFSADAAEKATSLWGQHEIMSWAMRSQYARKAILGWGQCDLMVPAKRSWVGVDAISMCPQSDLMSWAMRSRCARKAISCRGQCDLDVPAKRSWVGVDAISMCRQSDLMSGAMRSHGAGNMISCRGRCDLMLGSI